MLNMQVSFTIGSCDDAARALRILGAINDEYNGPEADVIDHDGGAPVPTETPAPRTATRRPRTPRATATDPVQAYNEKAAAQGAATVPTETAAPAPAEPEPAAEVPAEPAPAETVAAAASDDTRTTEELLAALRDKARENGGSWLRPLLEKYKVEKLSSLSDDQKREVLAS